MGGRVAYELIDQYLALERLMLDADDAGAEELGDALRDLMDPIWYRMSEGEHAHLNQRGFVSLIALYPITVPISAAVVIEPTPPVRPAQADPVVIDGCRLDAA